ncbi:hypothetical protein AVEN_254934-1 [Araneus ventricosus]|uniref:Uncharacterized protein n=1 Tax=Araneus ventricosus TaxID=182803 RepID=A0A4Y2K4B3_ARAVE|nr:hypothetical protein AVEN_254934-1 [Araneus ventricosus]
MRASPPRAYQGRHSRSYRSTPFPSNLGGSFTEAPYNRPLRSPRATPPLRRSHFRFYDPTLQTDDERRKLFDRANSHRIFALTTGCIATRPNLLVVE